MQAPVIPVPLLTARLLTFSFISTFDNSAQLYVCQVSQAHLRSGARKLCISKVTFPSIPCQECNNSLKINCFDLGIKNVTKLDKAHYFLLDKIYSLRLMVSFYYIPFNPETKQELFCKMSNLREGLVPKLGCLADCLCSALRDKSLSLEIFGMMKPAVAILVFKFSICKKI